jgi:uncharacterized protein YecT (DUF1311 family)
MPKIQMNKKQVLIAWFVFCVFCVVPACAQEEHPIDSSLGDCLDKSNSTAGMIECLKEAHDKWDAEMNRYYNLLMGILKEEAKKQLRQSQKAWLRFRDLEFEFIPNYYLDIGSYQGPTTWSHKVDVVRARALELQAYYKVAKDE